MKEDGKVDYVEMPGGDLGQVKAFYGAAFAFPGGRRFHFADPAGNELAVWSEA